MLVVGSSMISAVPKVGVEPTRLFRTTDFEAGGTLEKDARSANTDPKSHEVERVDHTSGQSVGIPDAVEVALADAIQKAAAAGAFDVLPKLVAELKAEKLAYTMGKTWWAKNTKDWKRAK